MVEGIKSPKQNVTVRVIYYLLEREFVHIRATNMNSDDILSHVFGHTLPGPPPPLSATTPLA